MVEHIHNPCTREAGDTELEDNLGYEILSSRLKKGRKTIRKNPFGNIQKKAKKQ